MNKQVQSYIIPIVKLVVFVICFIIFALPAGFFQLIPFISALDDKYRTLVMDPLLMISVFGALVMMTKLYRSPSSLVSFFLTRKGVLREILKGTLFGIVILSICAALLMLTGYVTFSIGKISIFLFLYYILYFLVIAMFEELLSRTYPLFVFAENYPIALAVLINGLLFGLLHALNPGFTLLAMLNITLAGMLFSMFTLYHRSINWAIGIHLGWNFAQGILFGYKVSGTDTPGVLIAKPTGVFYFSGGEFGIEGSLICTLVLSLVIVFLAMKYKIEPIKKEDEFN